MIKLIKQNVNCFLLVLLFFLNNAAFGNKNDSLYKVYDSKDKNDSEKVKAIVKMTPGFYLSNLVQSRPLQNVSIKYYK